jgi:polyketide biosynthesis enoyl-CoA hydratase PksI
LGALIKMTTSVVTLEEVASGTVELTMQDRQHKNTFSMELTNGLQEAFQKIKQMQTCRSVIVTGYDTYFCSGGTQESLLSLQAGEGKFTDTNLYRLALECEVPVVAAMQGHAIGGGFVFGLFADCVVMSRESIYTTNFMKYGFTPGMGATYVLPAKLGIGLAQEMLISARTYRGAELERRGVPFPVLPRLEVLEFARGLAKDIAEKPRVSLVTLKRHLVRQMRDDVPAVAAAEVTMHEATFRQPEVRQRIETMFGR